MACFGGGPHSSFLKINDVSEIVCCDITDKYEVTLIYVRVYVMVRL